MNDSLKDFIKENRAAFDSKEVPEVWSSIEANIKARQKWFNTVSFWRAAAIILFGISSFMIANSFLAKNSVRKESLVVQKDFGDLESFYSSQISEKMDLVQRFQSQTGQTEDDITQNLQKLEAMYQVLKEQMKKRPTQDVKDAMVLNLLVRIDLLNQQLNKLDKPKRPTEEKKIQS
jgi:hypothetical protein